MAIMDIRINISCIDTRIAYIQFEKTRTEPEINSPIFEKQTDKKTDKKSFKE